MSLLGHILGCLGLLPQSSIEPYNDY
uniref:Uncharacterized protein n=1 Tax=Arundo donax TaxID=35708 RepID=A0A0A9FW05_ARUDO